MDNKQDALISDIEQTRERLAGKLNHLEDQIRDTVSTTRSNVEHKIEEVKSTFEKFTPHYQIENNPLLVFGGVVAAGALFGRLLSSDAGKNAAMATAGGVSQMRSSTIPKLWHSISDKFGDEIELVKGMAVAGAVNFAADFIERTFPQFSEEIDEVRESALAKVDPRHASDHRRAESEIASA